LGQGTAPEGGLRANGAAFINLEKPAVFSGSDGPVSAEGYAGQGRRHIDERRSCVA
jgi:hypothetical protein